MDSVCKQCKRYEGCKSYKLNAEGDFTQGTGMDKPILIVLPYPSPKDDELNRIDYSRNELLKSMLDGLEVPYVVTHAVKCSGSANESGGYTPPTDEEIEHCRVFLFEEIKKIEPACIIWLGGVALKSVLGKASPDSVSAALKAGVVTQFGDIPIIGSYAPGMFKHRKRLIEEYISLFTLAEKIVKKEWDNVPFEYTVIKKESELPIIPASATPIFVDIEVRQSQDHPEMVTYFHPRAKLICCGFSYLHKGVYYNYVLIDSMCKAPILRRLFAGRYIYCQKTTYDAGGMKQFTGFDVYEESSDWGDTLNDSYFFDLGSRELGLKAQAIKYFGAADYASALNPFIESERERRNQALIRQRKLLKKGVEEVTLLPYEEPYATFEDVPEVILYEYNAKDGFYTARIYHEILTKREDWEEYKESPAYTLMKRALKFISYIERNGMPVSSGALAEVRRDAQKEIARLTEVLKEHPLVKGACAGFSFPAESAPYKLKPYYDSETDHYVWKPCEFNVKSSTGFLNNFAAYTGCHPGNTSKGGRLTFEGKFFDRLVGIEPAVPREELTEPLQVLRDVYTIKVLRDLQTHLLSKIDRFAYGGRLRSSYSLTSTETTRLTSQDPNLQNIKRGSPGRKVFKAKKGFLLGALDYDRIELVVLAYLAQEQAMLAALRRGDDLHQLTADNIGASRNQAKTVNFLTVYGGGAKKLAADLRIPEVEAQRFIDEFFASYPAIPAYYATLEACVRRGDPIVTPWGHKKHYTLTGTFWEDAKLQRQWQNFPVQGTASNITLNAACNCLDFILENELEPYVKPVNIIHDDVMYEIHEDYIEDILHHLANIMSDTSKLPFELGVPLNVGLKIGRNWLEMEEYKFENGLLVLKG